MLFFFPVLRLNKHNTMSIINDFGYIITDVPASVGRGNTTSNDSSQSTTVGGTTNEVSGSATDSVIIGGTGNTVGEVLFLPADPDEPSSSSSIVASRNSNILGIDRGLIGACDNSSLIKTNTGGFSNCFALGCQGVAMLNTQGFIGSLYSGVMASSNVTADGVIRGAVIGSTTITLGQGGNGVDTSVVLASTDCVVDGSEHLVVGEQHQITGNARKVYAFGGRVQSNTSSTFNLNFSGNPLIPSVQNTVNMCAQGGYNLWTNDTFTTGPTLATASNSWGFTPADAAAFRSNPTTVWEGLEDIAGSRSLTIVCSLNMADVPAGGSFQLTDLAMGAGAVLPNNFRVLKATMNIRTEPVSDGGFMRVGTTADDQFFNSTGRPDDYPFDDRGTLNVMTAEYMMPNSIGSTNTAGDVDIVATSFGTAFTSGSFILTIVGVHTFI